jgi:DNA-directed RNA polymerase beta subunit
MDDRDHYANKRLDLAGPLMANLFRQLFEKMIKNLKNKLQRLLNEGKQDIEVIRNIDENTITFQYFIDFLNSKLGDSTSRTGLNKIFENVMDEKVKEITPEKLHQLINELGDNLSLEDVRYILEKVSEPSTDINISNDEFYYIMTKKPADVDLITPITKITK